MSYLELDGDRHKIPPGEALIGSDTSSFLVLDGADLAPQHAVLVVSADGQVSVRRASEEATIFINGVQLGPQPAPLLHGDKIEVGGRELTFVDERRSGSTQFVSSEAIANLRKLAGGPAKKEGKATAGTGGRLVSLTDGREYAIEGPSIVFGREASCDVVVPQKKVSRRHAEIISTPKGYVVADLSSNGTFVNGERIAGQRLLARADVVRVGDHEFRFYADAATDAEPSTTKPTRAAPAGAEYRLGDTMHGIPSAPGPPMPGQRPAAAAPPRPAAPPPPARPPQQAAPPQGTAPAAPPSPAPAPPPSPPQTAAPSSPGPTGGVLANLIVRKGQLKGHRFPIRVPIVNVGRAEYNDLVVPDSSVSSAHAKVQLREGIWVVVDLGSTNGTFLDGDRVSGEAPIAPGAVIRFGEVGVVFESTKDDSAQEGGGTRVLDVIVPPEDQA